jgi:hypothetical protein
MPNICYTGDSIQIFDVDGHITEPPGLRVDHAPTKFKELIPIPWWDLEAEAEAEIDRVRPQLGLAGATMCEKRQDAQPLAPDGTCRRLSTRSVKGAWAK